MNLTESARLLCRCYLGGFSVFAAEPFNTARGVYQALLAGKERVACGTDFHVNVALVGRTGLEVVSAGAHNPHRVVFGMNLFLGHFLRQTFPAIFLIYCMGNPAV